MASLTPRLSAGALLIAALAGCAASGPSDPSTRESTSPMKPSTSAEPARTALLTVTVRQTAEAKPETYVLECANGAVGPATTLRGPEAACAAVLALGAEFFTAEPDPDLMCTQQYGGPQTAEIQGTINGVEVSTSFSLTDGCQITRWNALEPVLGPAGTP